jgi:hypothetical protein
LLFGAFFLCYGLYTLVGRFIVDAWIRRDLRRRQDVPRNPFWSLSKTASSVAAPALGFDWHLKLGARGLMAGLSLAYQTNQHANYMTRLRYAA